MLESVGQSDAEGKANKMTSENATTGGSSEATEHSLALLLRDHTAALSAISIVSLILGLPLAANMLWNLREKYYNLSFWF